MNRLTQVTLTLLFLGPTNALAIVEDDPLLMKVMLTQLELRPAGENEWAWEAEAWLGRDLDKLWLKTEGEYLNSEVDAAELQLLYSRAVTPYWDLQAGWRSDFRPEPERQWLTLGIQGLAPYLVEVDAALFLGEHGQSAVRLSAEYELMLTQQWVLIPEVEANAYGKTDLATQIGSGLSEIEWGIRLGYFIRRNLQPYLGVNGWRTFGNSKQLLKEDGEPTSELTWLLGIRGWF